MRLNNKGMTLVEFLVTIAIIGAVAIPVGGMVVWGFVSYLNGNTKINVSFAARQSQAVVLKSLREADQSSISVKDEHRLTFSKDEQNNKVNCEIFYDGSNKSIILKEESSQETLLKSVTEFLIEIIEENRITFKIKTITKLPFDEPYIFENTFDYKIRI